MIYRLAEKDEIPEVIDLWEQPIRIGWPVVVAVDDGKIVGYLATQDRDDAVVAGPIFMKPEHQGIPTLRMIEAYENLLSCLKIQKYLFFVDKEETPTWLDIVKRSGAYRMIDDTTHNVWFERTLPWAAET